MSRADVNATHVSGSRGLARGVDTEEYCFRPGQQSPRGGKINIVQKVLNYWAQ
jgi:hypothetical protein